MNIKKKVAKSYTNRSKKKHSIELHKCDRIDCYDAFVNGELWKRRVGWRNILTGIRKAMPRLARE
ncbi:MAG: hypothetical protein ACJAS1_006132 [Oleiphilaceae bacterium]|jgi:hypothetical protein